MYNVIFLDIDNTLLDFKKCSQESMKRAFEDFGLTYQEAFFEIFTEINNKLWKDIEKELLTKEELRNKRWNLIFEKCGIKFDGIKFEKKFEEFLAESHQPVEGALELLAYLSSKYDVYLVTNGFTNAQINRIALAGMTPYIKGLFISEAIGFSKPSKEFFEYCLSKIDNVPKNEVIIIGDSLSADIMGGINIGIHTLWYNHTGEKKQEEIHSDYTVNKLSEIHKIL